MSRQNSLDRQDTDHSVAEYDRNGNWQRWQMEELQQPRAPGARQGQAAKQKQRAAAARKAAEQARQREADKRQALYDDVRRQAETDGYQAGFERGQEEGRTQGLEEGRDQAKQELEKQIAQTVAPLEPLAREFTDALERLDDEVAQDLVELALSTGKNLAGEALDASPEQVLQVVRDLLHTEPPLIGQQRLWLHPDDNELVAAKLGDELVAAGWKLQPDNQLRRGSCRVTSAQGDVDATFESRWQAIKTRRTPNDTDTQQSGP